MIKRINIIISLLVMCFLARASDWTILVYMAADNGLYEYALQDIEQMEESQLANNTDIIVQIDGAEWSDNPLAYRYKIGYHPEEGIQSRRISSLGEIDSGDYKTLKSFIDWGFDKYSSSKKALVVWSHGDGWVKGDSSQEKYIAPDYESDSFISMSLHQMQKALASNPVDILIYDACTLQSIENLSELQGKADYIIGSEETVAATGFPYNDMFDYWHQESSIDSLAINIPLIYVDSYRPGNSQNSGLSLMKSTCSTAKMANWSNLEEEIVTYFQKWSSYPDLFIEARQKIFEFNHLEMDVDIMELLQYVQANTDNSLLANDTSKLLESLFSVFISYDSAAFGYKVGTATIWFPDSKYKLESMWGIYSELDFAQTSYPYFLNQFISPDEIAPLAFEIQSANLINETLYLEWEMRNDPDTLRYDVVLDFADNSSYTESNILSNNASIPVIQDGQVYIIAKDKSDNRIVTETVSFEYKQSNSSIYIAPNPVDDLSQARLVFYLPERVNDLAKVNIYSISGKKIVSKVIELADSNEYSIDLNRLIKKNLASGIYYCKVQNSGKVFSFKFAVQK